MHAAIPWVSISILKCQESKLTKRFRTLPTGIGTPTLTTEKCYSSLSQRPLRLKPPKITLSCFIFLLCSFSKSIMKETNSLSNSTMEAEKQSKSLQSLQSLSCHFMGSVTKSYMLCSTNEMHMQPSCFISKFSSMTFTTKASSNLGVILPRNEMRHNQPVGEKINKIAFIEFLLCTWLCWPRRGALLSPFYKWGEKFDVSQTYPFLSGLTVQTFITSHSQQYLLPPNLFYIKHYQNNHTKIPFISHQFPVEGSECLLPIGPLTGPSSINICSLQLCYDSPPAQAY